MQEFKIGDKVRYVPWERLQLTGSGIGTIVDIRVSSLLIEGSYIAEIRDDLTTFIIIRPLKEIVLVNAEPFKGELDFEV